MDTAAQHVQRRVHAGQDARFAQFQATAEDFLETFRHHVGHRQRVAHCFGRVATGKAAVGGRGARTRWQQCRHHLHRAAPAERPRIFVEALGRFGRTVGADHVDEIDDGAEVGVGSAAHAVVVAAVVVQHGGGVGRHVVDGGGLLGRGAPGRGQRAHGIGHAVALATAVVEVGQRGLLGGAAGSGFDHVADIVVVNGSVADGAAIGAIVRYAGPGRGDHCREGSHGRRGLAGIDQLGERGPDVEHAGQHAHAGIGLERGVAGIAALVGGDGIDKRGHAWYRRRIGRALVGRCGWNDQRAFMVGATAGAERDGDAEGEDERAWRNLHVESRTDEGGHRLMTGYDVLVTSDAPDEKNSRLALFATMSR